MRCRRLFGGTSHINAATMSTPAFSIVDVPHPNNNREQQQRLAILMCEVPPKTLVAATLSLRGRSPSRAQLLFDCCVSDGEDEPGSPFAKPQAHKASSVACPACHCCRYWPRAKPNLTSCPNQATPGSSRAKPK